MIAINRFGAFEILDFVQPCLAMSTGQSTHVQEREPAYTCRQILNFKTNCDPYIKMRWGQHHIKDIEYIPFCPLCILAISNIDYCLNDKSELNEFIQKYKK